MGVCLLIDDLLKLILPIVKAEYLKKAIFDKLLTISILLGGNAHFVTKPFLDLPA